MNKEAILVIGKGYVGKKIAESFGCDISAERINTYDDAEQLVKCHQPKVLINCIGYTGTSNVDDCELNVNATLKANTFVPLMLSEACIRQNIKFVHISSGCIYHFDYQKNTPITENTPADYLDLFYSRSKIYTEEALAPLLLGGKNILIARIRIPLDCIPHPRNLLTKLLAFNKVIDIPNSVSYLPDTVKALEHLIKIDARGIFNVVNKGGLRYPELLSIYKKHKPEFSFETMDYKDLLTPRTNLILSTEKLEKTGFTVQPITQVLEECVEEYIKLS